MSDIKEYIHQQQGRMLQELLDFLRIPSISADGNYKSDVRRCAEFVQKQLQIAGADTVELIETDGHPIVYGEKFYKAGAPTVLVYGHYDVQPADPLDLWDSPPFEPIVKDGQIYARGACDDKGQVYIHIKAFEYMAKNSLLKCNVKFMIEGEEEVGSVNLETFVKNNREKLKCDVVLVSDTAIINNETPSITVGLRGIAYMQIEVTGPNRDLHSGIYGGAVANPINVMCQMIASLQDENGKITIPGFYDGILEVAESDRALMASAPFDLDEYQNDLQIKAVKGEAGYSTVERASIRPTLDCNGIWGGYTGEGSKTVLPSKAFAKISMRLVPGQNPKRIAQLFSDHIQRIAPDYVKVKVIEMHGGEPVVTPTDSKAYQAAEKAMITTFGKKPIHMRTGGSIPIIAMFEQELKAKSILMGFGLDTDAIHSPNEKFGLFNFYKGIETVPYFFEYFAE